MSDNDSFSMDFDPSSHWTFNAKACEALPGESVINVYAAGPLTNNDPAVSEDCHQVREIVKRTLEEYNYEGIEFHVYDPADKTMPGSLHSPDDVYAINYEQCVKADVVFYHVTTPSLGVGCEAQIAADATVPRVVLARADTPVSRMFEGVFSTTIQTIRFANKHDLELQLLKNRSELAREVVSSAATRRPLLKEFADLELGRIVFRQRIIQNVPIADLARRTDCKEEWLRRLERNPILFACCSAMQLNRIATATECNLQMLGPNLTTLRPKSDELHDYQKESLDSLVNYVLSKDRWVEDDKVFRLWNGYVTESKAQSLEAVEYREGDVRALSINDWRRREADLRRLF